MNKVICTFRSSTLIRNLIYRPYIRIPFLTAPQSPKGARSRPPRLDTRKKSISLDSPDVLEFNQSRRGNGTIYENGPTG